MKADLPFGTCDVCFESVTTKRYPNENNRLLCWRHAPRRGYKVPEPLMKPRKHKRVFVRTHPKPKRKFVRTRG